MISMQTQESNDSSLRSSPCDRRSEMNKITEKNLMIGRLISRLMI